MKDKKDDKVILFFKDLIGSIVISFIIVFILTQFIVRGVIIDGLSMYPTLNDKEIGFSNIIGLKLDSIKRSDVVVIYLASRERFIVKRVIGMPGETVEARDGVIYINNEPLAETYLQTEYVKQWLNDNNGVFTADFGPIKVPDDSYFALGDNRQRSSDSRVYGSFKRDAIVSKDVFVIYPFSKFGNAGGS